MAPGNCESGHCLSVLEKVTVCSSELCTQERLEGRKCRQVKELLETYQQTADLEQSSTLVDQVNKEIPRVQRNPGKVKIPERE